MSGAGHVSISGGTVTIISDFTGSAIGNGDHTLNKPAGTLSITGGSLKAVRTNNSLTLNGD